MICVLCDNAIFPNDTGEPWIPFNENKIICSDCYISLIPRIYDMAGSGDGGIIHLAFKYVLCSSHNRRKRKALSQYKKILEELLPKYNFRCMKCETKDGLTIDHKIPVSKGGTDDVRNLQILCKSCNSRKGTKIE